MLFELYDVGTLNMKKKSFKYGVWNELICSGDPLLQTTDCIFVWKELERSLRENGKEVE